MSTGQKISELRKQQGYSLEDLADKLNVHRQTISRWECGRSVPHADDIKKLSDILGVSVDYLVNDEVDLTNKIDIVIKQQGAEIADIRGQNAMVAGMVTNMQKDIDLMHEDNEIAAAKEKKAKAKKTKAWIIGLSVALVIIAMVSTVIVLSFFTSNQGELENSLETVHVVKFTDPVLLSFICLISIGVIILGIIIGIAVKSKHGK